MRSPARVLLVVVCLVTLGVLSIAASAGSAEPPGPSVGGSDAVSAPVTTGRGDAGVSGGRAGPDGVQHFTYEYGPIEIEPGQNLIETTRYRIPQPTEDGWIVGFRPDLVLGNGKTPPVDQVHLHHGVWVNGAQFDRTAPLPLRFFAAGEEKTELRFPPGYGYQYRTSDYWFLNYMAHNLTARPYTVSITYEVDFLPATATQAAGVQAAWPVWMDVQNGSFYPVFDVHKGTGTDGRFTYPDDDPGAYTGGPVKNEWTVDRPGTLVHTFGHLHPGGLNVDLWLRRAGAGAAPGSAAARSVQGDTAHLFSSTAKYYEPAGAVSWDVSITATRDDWAVAVRPGDVLRLTATYDTSRASWYESMGLAVVWMADAPATGETPGADPFVTRVDRPGKLTHGHLPENDNHGGKRTKLPDPRRAGDGPATSLVQVAEFFYGAGDLSQGGPVPTVPAGGSITFENLDADALSVWHSITACRAPCTKSTGIAYPLADAEVPFDSGQLGILGPPTAGRLTWSTPSDLGPGTYTYFCRVHPFMRDAFRVTVTD